VRLAVDVGLPIPIGKLGAECFLVGPPNHNIHIGVEAGHFTNQAIQRPAAAKTPLVRVARHEGLGGDKRAKIHYLHDYNTTGILSAVIIGFSTAPT
jgi:hypothetical protein